MNAQAHGGGMDTTLLIRPKLWLLFGCLAGVVLAPIALTFVPNPFEGLAPGERPVRFFMVLWLTLPLLTLLAVWRLLSWTTYRATHAEFESRSLLGGKRWAWAELASAQLDTPVGIPPAYELRFGQRKVRLIAAHHDRKTIDALKALIER